MKLTEFTIDSPLKILLGRRRNGKDRTFRLNLNSYRNTHWTSLNNSKKVYGDIILLLMANEKIHLAKFEKIHISYQIVTCNKRKFDIMNIVSVVDKYFQDVMVHLGMIKDDNYTIVHSIAVLPVVIDTGLKNSFCRITVKGI